MNNTVQHVHELKVVFLVIILLMFAYISRLVRGRDVLSGLVVTCTQGHGRMESSRV